MLPELGVPRENFVFISGIGCSSRFPYYMNTYGFHSIHGRAPAIATGLKVTRPELSVWVVTGDGDALSIGGNHLIHALRRNVDVNILLFNNRIYGLTKGQYSPTSEVGKVTKSTPVGSVDHPFDPIALALGAEAIVRRAHRSTSRPSTCRRSCGARTQHTGHVVRRDPPELQHLQRRRLRRTSPRRPPRPTRTLVLEHGKPLIFGKNRDQGIRLNARFEPEVVQLGNGVSESDLLVHDEHNPALAYLLSRLEPPQFPTPIGVFLAVAETDLRAARRRAAGGCAGEARRGRRRQAPAAGRHLDGAELSLRASVLYPG